MTRCTVYIEHLKKKSSKKTRQSSNLRTLIFIHKIVNGVAPEYLTNRITYKSETQARTLSNANQIKLADENEHCSQNSLFYKGVKLYNYLPNIIKNDETINKYQNSLNKYVKEIFLKILTSYQLYSTDENLNKHYYYYYKNCC